MPSDYKGHYGDNFGLDDPKRGKASFDKPLRNLVREVDPEWEKGRRREVEYRMSNGRVFMVDPTKRGAYRED